MKKILVFLALLVWVIAPAADVGADACSGIFASVENPDDGLLVFHENGWMEQYSNASELPDNRISLGYITMMTTYEAQENRLLTAQGNEFVLSEEPAWDGKAYALRTTAPFFPTAHQLAASGLSWENDQLGTLTFSEDGTVVSDYGTEGFYDNGRLTLGGKTFLVQRSVWSDEDDGFLLCDQTLTLYEVEQSESTDRLLLVENGDILVLE